jgi:glutamate carboxypeptidase
VVQALFALNDPEKGITVNVGTIDGGTRPNVVAHQASAVVDVRVATREDARDVERAIYGLESAVPGTRLKITGRVGRPPMEKTPGNQRLWQLALEAADEMKLELEDGTAGGGSDGNFTSLHCPTLDGMGAVGDGAHALTEFVCVDKMPERAALLARLLLHPQLNLEKLNSAHPQDD